MSVHHFSPLPPLGINQKAKKSGMHRRKLTSPAFGSRQPRFTDSMTSGFKDTPGPGAYHHADDRSLMIRSPSVSNRGYSNAFVSKSQTHRGSFLEEDGLPYRTQSLSLLEYESSLSMRPSTSKSTRLSPTSSFANSSKRMPYNIPPRYCVVSKIFENSSRIF